MTKLLVQYRLKASTSPRDFEAWVTTRDYPAMRGLPHVAGYTNYRVRGLLMGEGEPDCDYVEMFDIPDFEGFTSEDMPGPVVQAIIGEFMDFVDNPRFLILDAVG
ncbi:MAG TPA: hypothetical protein VGB65_04400 [Allosphingosinicella sp.]|jgi:hypothetical protein